MATPEFISDFQQLLPKEEPSIPVSITDLGNAKLIIVLKQYKFHKQLCIELYQAATTQAGKLKNPLTLINPLDLVLRTNDVNEIRFFSTVARFQNNPTAIRTSSDLDALKTIINNPLQLTYYYHNPEFSENIVAGSIQPVKMGPLAQDLSICVQWAEPFYELTLQATIDGKEYNWSDLRIKYDYFFHIGDTLYAIGNFHLMNVVRFFARTNGIIRIHDSKFKSFRETILTPLADYLPILYPDNLFPIPDQVIQPGIDGQEKVNLFK